METLYSSGPLVKGSQAHIRALGSDDDVADILEKTRSSLGKIAFVYRRGQEVDASCAVGRDIFELLLSACLDKILIVASGQLSQATDRCRELLIQLGALSPRELKRSNSKVFDFGAIEPPVTTAHKKLGPNHFLAEREISTAPSRVFSSTHADPQKWMCNHVLLQNLSKQDIYALRILRKPHLLVVRTVELVALLTGRSSRPFPPFSALAPVVLTEDLLTELLLLQRQMIPPADLKKATVMLKSLDPEIVLRINGTAGHLVDWATAVTLNAYASSSKTFTHGIFARSNGNKGIDCIPVLKSASSRRLAPLNPRRSYGVNGQTTR